MQTQQTTLNNGLRIVTCSRPNTETVSLGIWIKTGSAYEDEKINSISHFLEHMVFKGTKNRTSLQISEEIENVGGQNNAYTSREFTAFYAKMLKDDTELALDVISDLILNPTFPEEELVKEREVVVQEIKQTIDSPDDIIFDYFQGKAFPDQPLGRSILGPAEKVRSFDGQALQNYLKTNYAAENIVVCAVGNLEHEKFVEMCRQRLSGLQPDISFTIQPQKYAGGFYVEKRDIEQTHVVLGFEGFDYNSDHYYPAMIFSTLFGGGMSSRLFQEIREKLGLVYTVYGFANSHTQTGISGIYAGTTADELQKLLPVVAQEIKKVCYDKVDIKELNRAKAQIKASMLMALESSSSTSEVIARQMLLFDRVLPIKEMVEKIENVTLDDIRDTATRIFSSKPTYTLLGSLKKYPDYEQLQQLIKL